MKRWALLFLFAICLSAAARWRVYPINSTGPGWSEHGLMFYFMERRGPSAVIEARFHSGRHVRATVALEWQSAYLELPVDLSDDLGAGRDKLVSTVVDGLTQEEE